MRLGTYAQRRALGLEAEPPAAPAAGDRRFADPGWQALPFAFQAQAFLLAEDWWKAATTGLRGVTAGTSGRSPSWPASCSTCSRPSNFPWSNPEVVRRTVEEGGLNLLRGLGHWLEDAEARSRAAHPARTATSSAGTWR